MFWDIASRRNSTRDWCWSVDNSFRPKKVRPFGQIADLASSISAQVSSSRMTRSVRINPAAMRPARPSAFLRSNALTRSTVE